MYFYIAYFNTLSLAFKIAYPIFAAAFLFAQVYSTYAQYCVWVNIKGKIRKQQLLPKESDESNSSNDNKNSDLEADLQDANLETDSQSPSSECIPDACATSTASGASAAGTAVA